MLGGGLVPGSVTLLAGDPGVGKSTLLLEVAHRWASTGRRALYLSGEESAGQIRLRAERTGCSHDEVFLAAESDLQTALGHIEAVRPSLVIVDSVQTMSTSDVDGVTGGVTQVRAVTTALTSYAKGAGSSRVAMILVGHVTKDGAIAGPRSLEHLVDVVLHFEGDRASALRMVRGVKNRFGAADEVGCFLLHDNGIEGIADPSGLFRDQRPAPVPGTAVTVTMDGKRPLIGEVQALVAESSAGNPRRATSGIDSSRAAMILAVLEKRAKLPLGKCDVYLSTVGGMRLTDPSTDLAVAAAIASAARGRPHARRRRVHRRGGPRRRHPQGHWHGSQAGRGRQARFQVRDGAARRQGRAGRPADPHHRGHRQVVARGAVASPTMAAEPRCGGQ